MSVYFGREKPRNFLVSIVYRFSRLLFISKKSKLRLFLNLEWIFTRLAHEYSFKLNNSLDHPVRITAKDFILKHISEKSKVLDLGCKYGEISYIITQKASLVVGIDHDSYAIEKARSLYISDKLKFIHDDALHFLNSSNEKFDILILSHILEHIDDPLNFLKNYTPHFSFIYIEVPDLEASFSNLYRAELKLELQYTDSDHVVEFDRKDILNLFEQVGLKLVESQYIYGVQKYWCSANKI